jgi:ABC-type sugar transport system, permease component
MTRRRAIRSVFYIVLLALAVFYLLPVYLMVLTGLKPFNEVDLKTMWDLPTSGLRIENFIAGYRQLAPNLRNSLAMVIPEALLSSLLGSFNGYLLSKWKFRGSNVIFALILFGMFIPTRAS